MFTGESDPLVSRQRPVKVLEFNAAEVAQAAAMLVFMTAANAEINNFPLNRSIACM